MSKTAEDNSYAGIANGTPERVIADITGVQGLAGPHTPMDYAECLKCMREFAAQEVEAYKELIRYEIAQLNSGLSPSQEPWDKGWAKGLYDAIKIIDTVK